MTWVLLDLNGTLVDAAVLAEPLGGRSEAPLIHAAFDDAVMLAMLANLAGRRVSFRSLLEAALRRRLALDGRDEGLAAEALRLLASMPAYPEAAGALARLAGAGRRLAVLTQSPPEAAEGVLRFAGLHDAVELVLSAEAAGALKPDPRVYAMALERTGAQAADTWMLAAHWWDVAGAKAAGLRTAWVSRSDRVFPEAVPPPDVRADDLRQAAEAILAA